MGALLRALVLCTIHCACAETWTWIRDADPQGDAPSDIDDTDAPATPPPGTPAPDTPAPPTDGPATPAPPASCPASALRASPTATLGCLSGDVPSGTACEATTGGISCGSATCLDGAWYPPALLCPCTFSSALPVEGATSHGTGCEPGGAVVNQASCVYTRSGHTCGVITCSDGAWGSASWAAGSAYPACHPESCPFDSLSVPQGASATDPACAAGGAVTSGTACAFAKPGHTCQTSTCTAGVWSTRNVACSALPCSYDSISPPAGAAVFGKGCSAGGSVASDPHYGCAFALQGHTCSTAVCLEGVWNDTAPACAPQPCGMAGLQRPADAVPTDCPLQGSTPSGTACSFISKRQGWSCSSATCSLGVWSSAVGCEPQGCPFDTLLAGSNSLAAEDYAFSGTACAEGETVPSGGGCNVTLPGHTCDVMRCSEGAWVSGTTPRCEADRCPVSALHATEVNATSPPNATLHGVGCVAGAAVGHQGSCYFKSPGLLCGHSQCLRGVWVPEAVVCERDPSVMGTAPETSDGGRDVLVYVIAGLAALFLAALFLLWFRRRRGGGGTVGHTKASPSPVRSDSSTEGETQSQLGLQDLGGIPDLPLPPPLPLPPGGAAVKALPPGEAEESQSALEEVEKEDEEDTEEASHDKSHPGSEQVSSGGGGAGGGGMWGVGSEGRGSSPPRDVCVDVEGEGDTASSGAAVGQRVPRRLSRRLSHAAQFKPSVLPTVLPLPQGLAAPQEPETMSWTRSGDGGAAGTSTSVMRGALSEDAKLQPLSFAGRVARPTLPVAPYDGLGGRVVGSRSPARSPPPAAAGVGAGGARPSAVSPLRSPSSPLPGFAPREASASASPHGPYGRFFL